jgi:hypothetical protein
VSTSSSLVSRSVSVVVSMLLFIFFCVIKLGTAASHGEFSGNLWGVRRFRRAAEKRESVLIFLCEIRVPKRRWVPKDDPVVPDSNKLDRDVR